MKGLILGNHDYEYHVTSEGKQLQDGLVQAGWAISGFGFDDNVNVQKAMETCQPDVVFVQDIRDHDLSSPGTYDKRVAWSGLSYLGTANAVVGTVLKDAAGAPELQSMFFNMIKPDFVLHYYHIDSVFNAAPWFRDYWHRYLPKLIRIYHTVDAEKVTFTDKQRFNGGVVSGARNADVYPLRETAFRNSSHIGLRTIPHPGYGNKGCDTDRYLGVLRNFKTHIACSSKYNFALRKIIESVACGCIPITDLPTWDVLPEIDGALCRVERGISADDLGKVVRHMDERWDWAEQDAWAKKARAWYDWRVEGRLTSDAIMAFARECR